MAGFKKFLLRGNVVDLAMRRWLDQEDPERGWMAAQIDAIFEESAQIARESGDGIVRWKFVGFGMTYPDAATIAKHVAALR